MLERLLAAAKSGDVVDVVVAFTTKDDRDGVQASPMSVIKLNHLWRLFDERVRGAYREVRQRASAARAPTAGVSATQPKAKSAAAARIPRVVRRAIAKKARKMAERAAAAQPTPPKAPAATN